MDFSLNEVQSMLADSIEKFVANDYDFESRQKHSGSETGYSKEVWQTFAELGWTAVPFSEDDGGFDGGPVDMMLVMERLGRGLIVEPYLANIVLAGGVLKRAANAEQKAEWLAPLIGGELQATLAFVEPQARYDINNVATTAVKSGDSWLLNGSKGYVLNGGNADLIIVPARTAGEQDDKGGITLFGLRSNTDGVFIRDYETIDGQRAAEINLRDVTLPADRVIGEVDSGFETLQLTIDDATLAVCSEAVGIMSVLTEKTIEYSKSRVQFGVPISSFQALQHRMVEMYTACEQSRSVMMWAAMTATDGGEDTRKAMHSLKYQIGVAGTRVGEEAVQIHGGMGVTWELDVAHYFKRLTAINLMFGNADWHLDRLSGTDHQ
ncbi:MAG: pimeloyl-CoA dehydrogenase small subunit [Gammaproteobacteria bacterium]|jgi:alkylation response protein AidB-like acyl-CoA dehydrogenase|nr:pimeloyl-CoA dehydrogenase small subunit [Gammaproteobacteria bacterium]